LSPAQVTVPDPEGWVAFRDHVDDLGPPSLSHTGREILLALKFFGQLTVPALGATLGLSVGPLRQHLRHLNSLGLVASRTDPAAGLGRPPAIYWLDTAGERLFPDRTSALGRRALRHMAERTPDALHDFLQEAARGAAARSILDYRGGHSPEGGIRPSAALDYLETAATDIGYLPFLETGDGHIAVTFNHCPFLDLVETFPAFCDIERNALNIPFPRCTVERTAHRLAGDRACTYVLRFPAPVAS